MKLDKSRLPALVWCDGTKYVSEIYYIDENGHCYNQDKEYLTNTTTIHNTSYRIIYLPELQNVLPEYFI